MHGGDTVFVPVSFLLRPPWRGIDLPLSETHTLVLLPSLTQVHRAHAALGVAPLLYDVIKFGGASMVVMELLEGYSTAASAQGAEKVAIQDAALSALKKVEAVHPDFGELQGYVCGSSYAQTGVSQGCTSWAWCVCVAGMSACNIPRELLTVQTEVYEVPSLVMDRVWRCLRPAKCLVSVSSILAVSQTAGDDPRRYGVRHILHKVPERNTIMLSVVESSSTPPGLELHLKVETCMWTLDFSQWA